jgi:hypothetical protein
VKPQISRSPNDGAAFKIAAVDRVGAVARDFASRRMTAYCREEGGVSKGEDQQTTERGQDKSRQCAARLGSCYLLDLSPFLQCFQIPRNVRAAIKPVLALGFPHIAEVGDG